MVLSCRTVRLPLSTIPVYRPDLSGNERAYVNECVETSWISSIGSFIDPFERAFSERIGAEHAISVSNGTVALHLAFHCLGIGLGDEVIVPTFTYIASVNTIKQTGATRSSRTAGEGTGCLTRTTLLERLRLALKRSWPFTFTGRSAIWRRSSVSPTKPACPWLRTVPRLSVPRLTAAMRDIGDVSTFSFFGNKTITTGEGGMVTARHRQAAQRLRRVKGQGQSLTRRYWHDELGFNYRMTNICAAIGLAQLERADAIIARKREIADIIAARSSDSRVTLQRPASDVKSSEWLFSLLLPPDTDRASVMIEWRNLG